MLVAGGRDVVLWGEAMVGEEGGGGEVRLESNAELEKIEQARGAKKEK